MKTSIIPLLLILLLFPVASYASKEESARFESASEGFFQHGDYDSALTMAEKAAEADSSNASAYCLMGRILLSKGVPDKAEKAFMRAIFLKKDMSSAYAGRARALLAAGNDKDALAVINRLISLYPEYSDGYNARGELYLFSGLYRAAVSDFTTALKHAPMNYSALANRALAFIRLDDFKSASADADAVLEAYAGIAPGTPGTGKELAWAYYYKGLVYEAENRIGAANDAVKCFKEFLKCKRPPFSDDAVKHAESIISQVSGADHTSYAESSSGRADCCIARVVRQGADSVCVELKVDNRSSVPVYSVRAENFDLSLDGEPVGRRTAVFVSRSGSAVQPGSSGTLYFVVSGVGKAFSTWNVHVFEFEINKR